MFAMYNYYREDWLIDRLGGTAAAAFGHDPCIDLFGEATAVVAAAKDPDNQNCGAGQPRAAGVVRRAGHRQRAVPVLRRAA